MLTVHSQDELDGISGPVLCKFGATWCMPCRDLEKQLLELEHDFAHKCTFVSVDVDAAEALCTKHGILQIPYVKIAMDGSELMSRVNPSREEIFQALDALQTVKG